MGAISSTLIVSFRWPSFFSLIFFLSGRCCSSTATNVITSSTPIRDRDGESLVSAQGAFELGFFTPGLPGPNRYLGIWFRKSADKIHVVWVANPKNPLTDSSGILKISEESGLVLLDGEGNEEWSVAIESPHLCAELQDDGNFVVIDDSMSSNIRRVIWQSFHHPSNTLLRGSELKRGQTLRAWKGMSDPAGGDFWLELDPQGSDELFLRQGSNIIYWRSGLWDQKSRTFSNATDLNPGKFYFYFTLNTSKITYRSSYDHTRLALKYTGQLQFSIWYEAGGRWILVWSVPEKYCDIPAGCGPNGVCMNGRDPPCLCLRGFRQASKVDWGQGDYRGGCIRETPLTCNDGVFMPVSIWALPMNGTSVSNVTEAGCKSQCFDLCKCTAYSFVAANLTCTVWSEDLMGLNDAYYYDTLNAYQPTISLLHTRLAQPQGGRTTFHILCFCFLRTTLPYPSLFIYTRPDVEMSRYKQLKYLNLSINSN